MIIISTSLTKPGQPLPRFHVKTWLPFGNFEMVYWGAPFDCFISCLDDTKVEGNNPSFWETNHPPLHRVRANYNSSSNSNPREGWVSILPENDIDPIEVRFDFFFRLFLLDVVKQKWLGPISQGDGVVTFYPPKAFIKLSIVVLVD